MAPRELKSAQALLLRATRMAAFAIPFAMWQGWWAYCSSREQAEFCCPVQYTKTLEPGLLNKILGDSHFRIEDLRRIDVDAIDPPNPLAAC
ncbi:MAG: hypothetical protein ABSG03_29340 [Bryobacteraceae bacterium]|jgi:hypothetical protein